jgi:hypothetical protein
VAQDSSSLLEYAKFLREEEKAHREYLEKLYTTTTIVLGILVTIGIGLVSFFQIKTKKDVREAVDAAFRETVGEEVQNRMEQFRKDIVQIEKGQQLLKSDTNAIRVALKGIVTKYEHEYLRRLADPQPFPSEVGDFEYHYEDDKHHYTPDVYPRLKRLDDIGYIRPTEIDGHRRLLRIVDDHARDESRPNEKRPRFKLREYAEITEAGRNYLALAGLKYL